jgi:hypothetical protein
MLKKFYEFFSLLYDTKVCTPFSQFLEGEFLTEFKKKIKQQLSEPDSARSHSKDKPNNIKTLDLPKTHKRSRTNDRDNLMSRDVDHHAKETSRFGTTPVEDFKTTHEDLKNERVNGKTPMPQRIDSNQSNSGKVSNHENTLSLSFIANAEDRSYIIYDSAYGYNHGYKAMKQNKRTRQRIERYTSDRSEVDSSKICSKQSTNSYKIEYLMSKAFTPIVPSANYMNDISKISWNNRELFENISYSGITESILMGRNPSMTNSAINNTEKHTRNRSLIWQSKGNENSRNTFKSPQPRGNRVKQPLQYHRSLSNNEQRTISSIVGTQAIRNFPPIGFNTKHQSDSIKDSQDSNRASSIKNVVMSNNSSIMSPKADYRQRDKAQLKALGHRRGQPLKINRTDDSEEGKMNISKASNEVEPMIVS